MYNENDLKTIHFAYKGGMKKYQLAQLMGIPDEDCAKMLECARKKFGSIKQEKELPGMHRMNRDRLAFFHRTAVASEEVSKPFTRPTAKYDNKSSEERINELLNADV